MKVEHAATPGTFSLDRLREGNVVVPLCAPRTVLLVCMEFGNAKVDTQGAVVRFLVDLETGRRLTDRAALNLEASGGFYIKPDAKLVGL